jgi:hypothetical protein
MRNTTASRRDGACGIEGTMNKRLAALVCLILVGLSLAACSKCDPLPWETGPRSCRSDKVG